MSDLQSSTAAQSPLPDPETKEQTSGKADDGSDTEREDDRPAMFPALGSAQRIASPASTASTSTKAGSMLNASSLMPPPSFLKLPVTAGRPKKGKVALEPGFSPLDWAIHKTSVQAPKVRPSLSFLTRSTMTVNPRVPSCCPSRLRYLSYTTERMMHGPRSMARSIISPRICVITLVAKRRS